MCKNFITYAMFLLVMNELPALLRLLLISAVFVLQPVYAVDSDTMSPNLLGFDFSPQSLNTTFSSQDIKFTAHLTDDLSGIYHAQARFRSPSKSQSLFVYFSSWDRVSGTNLDGIYESSATLPRYSEQGYLGP